ncbi:hypothetical protein [Actibacterium pelagium]|uniref:Uncharacterized protein n=1 Tax=Actibacterium pelagium TaxID=2029103 RepID=A0A917EM34_9RHOB|nr:hypothetical protein [Actibacterium pelagium]GGE61909.1 hypothetical protein GCM10011517_31940 [Actibacterium pelagium]
MTLKTLWSDADTGKAVTCHTAPSEQTVAILDQTIWGSRATRYRILGVSKKLARLRDPRYFVLSEKGRELCVFVLDYCHKNLMGQSCGAWHFVMASTVTDRQNEGLAGILIEHIRDYCLETVGSPGFGFAYVEESTVFSLKLSEQIGYAVDAEIPLTLFSRLFPRPDREVSALREDELEAVTGQLQTLYQDHELDDFRATLKPEEFMCIRDENGVVAGAQAELLNWSVQSMPGLTGVLLLKVLPHVPGLNRFLNLRNLRIVRFGNILMPEGAEAAFFEVLETALAKHDAKVGLIMLDARSPMLTRLREKGQLGVLSGALKGSAKLHIDVVGMDDAMLERLSKQPLLVSAGDVF